MVQTASKSTGRRRGNMTEGSPLKCMVTFALPLILGNLFQQFYQMVDSIIVGRMVGSEALAAVGASTSLTQLFVMIALGTGVGCSVVISQLFGANRPETLKTAISTELTTILVFSVTLSIVGRLLSGPILQLLKTPANVYPTAKVYLDIYFYGFFFLFLYNAFTSVFNALGDSGKPLLFLIFSSLLNIMLDILFVGSFGMGVAGAAWATLIAQACASLLCFAVLIRKLKQIPSGPFRRYDTALLSNMTKVALPTILQQSMVSIGMLLIQGCVNQFGSVFLAGYTAACRIDGIAIVPMVNTGNAVSTFVAQNMGAGKVERAKKGYHIGLAMAAGVGVLIGIVMQLFGPQIIGLFMNASEAADSIAVGAKYLSVVSMFYFVMGSMNCTTAVLRGSGDMKIYLLSTLVNLLVRVVLTYMFAVATGGFIIMIANPIGWACGFVIAYVRYRQGKWKQIKLI